MAKSDAVWGIDVGQSAFKALKCRLHNDGKRLVAEAFDFIEYPKILSQPDADPAELISDAIEQFLSRNDVKNDKVAISVSGQSGLARFIKLPPVESKKIPDIVKFEARQQIPFALEDVVWDFQQMAGGSEEDGYTLETEVGLFAMKRDQVFRALRPFTDAGIELDLVQLTPIALFNFIVFDQLQNRPAPEQFDPENPPESVVVMSLGTDTTDLVVTNGYRVWQRSIPLGGSHFTKAITKEMKVTFTKAEQLKRNALKTEDAKVIFQAMRPIFSDLVTEVQRSISFFGSLNKTARLGKIVALGNTMKLRGLQKYLAQNLGMDVVEPEKFRGLTGNTVVDSAAFKDNHLAFAVCYGLCVQGVGKGTLATNLLPDEIFQDRFIKEKKPWAVAAVASVLVGCALGFAGHWRAWASAQEDKYKDAFAVIQSMSQTSSGNVESFTTKQTEQKNVEQTGKNLAGIAERRLTWIELMKALNECLPRDPGKPPENIMERNQLHITRVDCEFYPNLQEWFSDVGSKWQEQHPPKNAPPRPQPAANADAEATAAADATATEANAVPTDSQPPANGAADPAAALPAAAPPADATADPVAGADPAATGEPPPAGPTGAGWVIELEGHHYHNKDRLNRGEVYIKNTLIRNLENATVDLPVFDAEGRETIKRFTMKELGIDFAVITVARKLETVTIGEELPSVTPAAPTTDAAKSAAANGAGAQAAAAQLAAQAFGGPKPITAQKCDFIVQFCWQETPASVRLERANGQQKAKPTSDVAAVPQPAATKQEEATQ